MVTVNLKKVLLAAAGAGALVLVLVFVSCAPEIKEGEVYAKAMKPAYTVLLAQPVPAGSGKLIIVPRTEFHPDSWSVSYRKFNKNSGKWDSATVSVSQEVYNATQIGSWYTCTDSRSDK